MIASKILLISWFREIQFAEYRINEKGRLKSELDQLIIYNEFLSKLKAK